MKQTPQIILLFAFFLVGLVACQPTLKLPLKLATSTENFVDVTVTLVRENGNQFFLSATFTPLESDLHLYSKEIPKRGVNGLGRPTLLELAKNSAIKANGELIENAAPQTPFSGPQEMLVYPAGAITLNLPVILPAGKNWLNEQVVVTYMACSGQSCRAPVEGKIISIQIPEKDVFN
jgi:hypothetical protein